MKPTAAQLRELKRQNLRFPRHLVSIPREQWPDTSRSHFQTGSVATACFRNGYQRLSINRTEWDERQGRFRDDISWDDVQRLKAEAGYGDRWAVEVFPPEDEIVNVANMRHVWLLDQAPACAWQRQRAAEAA